MIFLNLDHYFAKLGLLFGITGLSLGIYMAVSGNFSQYPTHAHIMLIGLVVSMIYGIAHKLWLHKPASKFAIFHLFLHTISALLMFSGLFYIKQFNLTEGVWLMMVKLGAGGVFAGLILFTCIFFKQA